MIEKITVPDIGEGVASGKVVAVLVAKGDAVQAEDTLIELETDKAVVEIPTPVAGTVVDILVREGDDVAVGSEIAGVETASGDSDAKSESSPAPPDNEDDADGEGETSEGEDKAADGEDEPADGEDEAVDGKDEAVVSQQAASSAPSDKDDDQSDAKSESPPVPSGKKDDAARPLVAASPSIRRMARELGVDIRSVPGSGPGGRISESDIKRHVRKGRQGGTRTGDSADGSAAVAPLPDFSRWGTVEEKPLETVRRLTAESTTASWHAVPHVTQFDKADITGLQPFLDRHAERVAKAGGKLTVTAVLAKICAEALVRNPRFNASIDMQRGTLIMKSYINIGIAVDTPNGLFMPVIYDADRKSITALSVEIVDLAQRARDRKIKPSELEGGTFSISNQGGIGGVAFTPIVLWPQVAILGVSRSAVEPVAQGDVFVPRTMLPLSLSYDHRVIDGADAARVLKWICQSLEQPLQLFMD